MPTRWAPGQSGRALLGANALAVVVVGLLLAVPGLAIGGSPHAALPVRSTPRGPSVVSNGGPGSVPTAVGSNRRSADRLSWDVELAHAEQMLAAHRGAPMGARASLARSIASTSALGKSDGLEFTNLTGGFDQYAETGLAAVGLSSGFAGVATNGSTALFAGYLENGSSALASYTYGTGDWSVVQVAPDTYGGVVALSDSEYFVSAQLGTKVSDRSVLEVYDGATFTRITGVIPGQNRYAWYPLGTDALGDVFLTGDAFLPGTSVVVYELDPGDGFKATNLTGRLPAGGYFYVAGGSGSTVAFGGSLAHVLPENGASTTPLYGVYNETTGKYHALNPSKPKVPANDTVELVDAITEFGGSYYFGEESLFTSFTNSSFILRSLSSGLFSYDLASGTLTNRSHGLPVGANIEGMFDLPGIPGVALGLSTFNVNSTQPSGYSYNEYYVFDTAEEKLLNRTAEFGSALSFYAVTETATEAVIAGVNGSDGDPGIEFVALAPPSVEASWVSAPSQPLLPSDWLSETVAGDGGYLTVGGNGFAFYANGSWVSSDSFAALPGFFTGAAWDGSVFLLVGQYFGPGDGLLAYEFDPADGALRNVTGLFPAKLSTNAELLGCVWNGTAFVLVGEADASAPVPSPLLFVIDPTTSSLTNDSSLLAKKGFNLDLSADLLATDQGTYLFGTGVVTVAGGFGGDEINLGVLNGSKFTNLSAKLPVGFDLTGIRNGGTLGWDAGRLFIAGNLPNGSVDVLGYDPSTGKVTNYEAAFAGDVWSVGAVAVWGADLYIGGYNGSAFTSSPGEEPFLLEFAPGAGSKATVRNLSADLPVGFGQLYTLASNATVLFVGGGLFGAPEFGLLRVAGSASTSPAAGAGPGLTVSPRGPTSPRPRAS